MTDTRQQNVVDLLLEQHGQIRDLFAKVQNARGRRKEELFSDLVRLLAVHETAEEEIVHPASREKIPSGEKVVAGRLKEESEAKKELATLYDLGVDHPDFDEKLAELAEAVTAHADHEERQEFSQLRKVLSEDELRKMAGAVRAAEAIAPTRPHPAAGESAVGNLVLGPPLAMFDRMRDAVRDWSRSNKG
ncbi:hemerythrin domain-containing protein [Actinopolymorpha rutila]|uniref:Hemerythrin superfamily protein n=1 Tax=Actinopolymorpha rutila TaxID=446787 RepID=A0A852ZFY4_9ACTN|nr:hemerythrin domain-containing protein [Actinopolymorpha rutila]NYH88549.1 hemerythrin superfamily protein [Actinopolymorpha rutila]